MTADPVGRGAPERPLGLGLLLWLFAFWAGATALVFLGFAIGDGPIMMSGRAVPRTEALATVLPLLVPMFLAVAGAALAIGLRRAWARAAILLPFALLALAPALDTEATRGADLAWGLVVAAPFVAGLAWYLYSRPSTVAYFEALKERGRAAP